MSDSFSDFYRGVPPSFHQVIALHEEKNKSFDELKEMIPLLPRGWFELSRLSNEDRLEFTRDFWLSKLPFEESEKEEERVVRFFETLEEISIFASQQKEGGIFEVHMVYGLKEATGYFHGFPPASEEGINNFASQFGNLTFPKDYLAFLGIHDGFSKFTDTGLIRTRDMSKTYLRFQEGLSADIFLAKEGEMIDPKSLIPFYEAFGLNCFQCFYGETVASLGSNVYYSEFEEGLSDYFEPKKLDEEMAFSTFLKWLCFYLEDVGFLE